MNTSIEENTPLFSSEIHTVSAVYPSREEAAGVRQILMERGIAAGEIRIFQEAP